MKDFVLKYFRKYKRGIGTAMLISFIATAFVIYTTYLIDSPIQKEACFELEAKSFEPMEDCYSNDYSQSLELLTLPFVFTLWIFTYPFEGIKHSSFYNREFFGLLGLLMNMGFWGTFGMIIEIYVRTFFKFLKEKY